MTTLRLRILTLLTTSLLMTGCEITHVVLLVGDSIAASDLLPPLHHHGSIQYQDLIVPVAAVGGAALGRDYDAFRTRLQSAERRGIPVDGAIVSLTTNDTRLGPPDTAAWPHVDTPEKRAEAIDRFMRLLPPVNVLWLVPHGPAVDQEKLAALRASLVEACDRWDNLHLLDAELEWYGGEDADGVHLTRTGEVDAALALLAELHRVGM